MNSSRPLSLVILLALVVGCGKNSPTAPNNTTPTVQFYTLAGIVTETAPTTATAVPDATVRVVDGVHVGKTTMTDATGNFTLGSLSGNLNVEVSKPGYLPSVIGAVLDQTRVITTRLAPSPQILTSTRNESISGGDPICISSDPCKTYLLNVHHSGGIDASLTWTDGDTWLWLRLSREDGTEIAESSSSRVNGLRQRVTANVTGGQAYRLTVRWLFGARVTPFSLTAIRPN